MFRRLVLPLPVAPTRGWRFFRVSRKAVLPSLVVLVAISACSDRHDNGGRLLPTEMSLAKAPPGPTDPSATFKIPTNDLTLGLRGDGLYPSGDTSVYAHGVCGVNSKIFATTQASNSGDAIMHTNNPKFSDRRCQAYPRTVTIEFGPGDIETAPAFINVREIAHTTFRMAIGSTVPRILHVNAGGRCDGLVWGDQFGGDLVNVTRVDASTWLVESQSLNNQAYCRAEDRLYSIAVRFTIVSNEALPLP